VPQYRAQPLERDVNDAGRLDYVRKVIVREEPEPRSRDGELLQRLGVLIERYVDLPRRQLAAYEIEDGPFARGVRFAERSERYVAGAGACT
jgi:hypothetical protein